MIDPNMKFLVVDDFPIMRRIMRNLLRELGFNNVYEAEDGLDALAKLRADAFDFVITDYEMPNLSGMELLRAIRADSALHNLPVMMIAGAGPREKIIEALQAGANGYFTQPYTAGHFYEKLNKIFQSRN